jgi:hypothetical protein
VGATASPRFAPAGLLVIHSRHRVVFDGGPRVQPPEGRVEAWLVADERAELESPRRLVAEVRRGLSTGQMETTGQTDQTDARMALSAHRRTVNAAIVGLRGRQAASSAVHGAEGDRS